MKKLRRLPLQSVLAVIAILVFVCLDVSASYRTDSIINVLGQEIAKRNTYYETRELRISNLKSAYSNLVKPNPAEQYSYLKRIYDEYKSYQYDSAYVYASKMLETANNLHNDSLINLTQVDLAFIYMSGGLFVDADNVSRNISLKHMNGQQKAIYFNLMSRLYSDMSNFQDSKFSDKYAQRYYQYGDSVLKYADKKTYLYKLKEANFGTNEEKIKKYTAIIGLAMDSSEKAVACSILGDIYNCDGNSDMAMFYKAMASILDIQTGIRETAAKKDLAFLYFKEGDIQNASLYIQLALEDANFYNARQRKIDICELLPDIEQARYRIVELQQKRMVWLSVIISLLCILVITGLLMLWKQMKAKSKAYASVAESNLKIQMQNEELAITNTKLKESEHIKDLYIGNAFYGYTSSIERLEKLYRTVNRKLGAKQYDDVVKMFSDSDLQNEREQIYSTFDADFLRLFPDFVKHYNELFNEEDRVVVPENSLNTEMRIFALIRLGISETEKIAKFLNYSVNTINTYKTKVKNRSFVSNIEFEQRIMHT